MKKRNMWSWIMIVIPMLALLLACAETGVSVFYPEKNTTTYLSYLELVPDCSTAVCLPLAVALTGLTLTIGVYNLITGKQRLKGMYILSLLACCLASLPIVVKSEGMVVLPNTIVPILMAVECVMCYHFSLKGLPVKEKESPRLKLPK